jgi:hypothetical protein
MWIKVGSVRNVKPAQRISTVAFPIKNIEPFVKSVVEVLAAEEASKDMPESLTSLGVEEFTCDRLLYKKY